MTEKQPRETLQPAAPRNDDPGIIDTTDSGKTGRGLVAGGERSNDGGTVDTNDTGKIDRSLEE